jgi:AraC-like DNA-binding protein
MESSLIFLATSRVQHNQFLLDKYLNGYSTIQFSPSGGVEVGYNEKMFVLTGGAWFWPAHPGERIRFQAAPGYNSWPHRHVGFRGALVEKWNNEGIWLQRPQRAPSSRSAEEWDEWFAQWQRLSQRTDERGRLRAINLLEGLLLELADARASNAESTSREPWLRHAIEKITVSPDNASLSPNYQKLAHELGMSEATLRRRFKRAMSISPHGYALQSRAATARALLTETDMPLKEIAARLGYDNEYFFSRQFKQIVGVAPGAFRKSRLAGSAQ